MRVCSLFSGGKDSTYALHWAWLNGFDVKCLITIVPQSYDSLMFHRPALEFTPLQARALNIPHILSLVKEGENELEVLASSLRKAIKRFNLDGLVVGVLLSDYQRMRINFICEELGLRTYSPLWRKDQRLYLMELIDQGFKFILTAISALGLTPEFLGKIVDRKLAKEIIYRAERYGFNPGFEGGEAETLVLDGPLFRERLEVANSEIMKTGINSWRLYIKKIKLVKKSETPS